MIQWLIDNQELATLLFTAVVALSTVIYAALTALLVFETRDMRRVHTEPKLWATYEPREEFINFGHLYLRNIGFGPAYDISIELTPDGSLAGSRALIEDFAKVKAFGRGIAYLGPSQFLKSGFTSFVESHAEKIKAIVVVRLKYKSATGRKYSDVFQIDFSEFEGAGQLGTPHLYAIAKSLEKIKDDVHHLSTGFHKLKVLTYSHADREREAREWEQQRNEFLEEQDKDA